MFFGERVCNYSNEHIYEYEEYEHGKEGIKLERKRSEERNLPLFITKGPRTRLVINNSSKEGGFPIINCQHDPRASGIVENRTTSGPKVRCAIITNPKNTTKKIKRK